MRFGHYSDEPCEVCGGHKNNQIDPRFSYTVCEDHQRVPPAFLQEGKRQFKDSGTTQWDRRRDNDDQT